MKIVYRDGTPTNAPIMIAEAVCDSLDEYDPDMIRRLDLQVEAQRKLLANLVQVFWEGGAVDDAFVRQLLNYRYKVEP